MIDSKDDSFIEAFSIYSFGVWRAYAYLVAIVKYK